MKSRLLIASGVIALFLSAGCGQTPPPPAQSADAGTASAPAPTPAEAEAGANPVALQDMEAAELLQLNTRLFGDFPEMQSRRFVRALVPYGRTWYFLDGARQRGLAYDVLMQFERTLAERTPKGEVAPKVVIIPTSRDRLMTALAEGYGDIAVGGTTITEARREHVDFSEPSKEGIRDVVVTGADGPMLAKLDDLSGREVQVRKSSSYYEDLVALNERFKKQGLAPVKIRAADELLEDEDLLQMADAGVVPITVVKDLTAHIWDKLYDRITVHDDLVLRTDGQIAMAVRKDTPAFLAIVNQFVREHRAGTMFGNMMLKQYFGNVDRLKNSTSEKELQKFRDLAPLFQKASTEAKLDWLLLGAQGFQESQLDQSRKSPVGAVGVMQIKPETAADKNVGIPNVNDAGDNIRAGAKYMRFMIDRYFADAPMDQLNKGLFALASYNAGPARVARLRTKAEQLGLNPNVWFRNVEMVAAREIGRETVDYVSNIYKYYTAYRGVADRRSAREQSNAPRIHRQ